MSALDAPGHSSAPPSTRLIKCLVWDLDETLWAGVQAEGDQPEARPAALALMDELSRRGIVQSVASRNDSAYRAPDSAAFPAAAIAWSRTSPSVRSASDVSVWYASR